jgi:hypothetical protein
MTPSAPEFGMSMSSMHAGPPEGLAGLPCPAARNRLLEPVPCRLFDIDRPLAATAKHPKPPTWAELTNEKCWRFGDLAIWRFGDLAIWRFGDFKLLGR